MNEVYINAFVDGLEKIARAIDFIAFWFMVLVIGTLINSCTAHAEQLVVKVSVIDNRWCTPDDQFLAVNHAKRLFRRAGVKARFDVVEVYPDADYLYTPDMQGYYMQVLRWQSLSNPKRISIAVVAPMADLAVPRIAKWLGGAANTICDPRGGWAWAAIKQRDADEYRMKAGGSVVAHELMHLAGASHIPSEVNVMSAIYSESDRVLPRTKREIRSCLRSTRIFTRSSSGVDNGFRFE